MLHQQSPSNMSPEQSLEDARPESIEFGLNQTALPEDNDSPAEAAKNPLIVPMPHDHPAHDSPADAHEVYEEGESGIAYMPEVPAKYRSL